jgi:carbonic anhydrase
MDTKTKGTQSGIAPARALELLKEGNNRFFSGNMRERDSNLQVRQTHNGQSPFAVVLGCIDSLVPSELVFDQGFGDIFNVRVAGNFANTDIIGSIEYCCKVAGAKLVVVLGDENCWAIKAVCDGVELGNISSMLCNLKDAVSSVEETGDRSSANSKFVSKVVNRNVEFTVDDIKADSPILMEMERNGEIMIVGAVYDSSSGKVIFK